MKAAEPPRMHTDQGRRLVCLRDVVHDVRREGDDVGRHFPAVLDGSQDVVVKAVMPERTAIWYLPGTDPDQSDTCGVANLGRLRVVRKEVPVIPAPPEAAGGRGFNRFNESISKRPRPRDQERVA